MEVFQPMVRSILLKTMKGPVDLKHFKPADPLNFEIGLEIAIGIKEFGDGSERFDISVCTPKWISDNLKNNDCKMGHGMLILREYSYDLIVGNIQCYVEKCVGNTVDDVLRRIGLLGEWESEWEIQRA